MTRDGPEAPWRVFVACPIPRDLLGRVGELQAELGGEGVRPTVRWARPEGVHLTLRFLGPLVAVRIDDVISVLEQVGSTIRPGAVSIGGGGAFPSVGRPRVLWLDVHDEDGALARLAEALEHGLARARFEPDRHRFRAHLTIGRADGSPAAADVASALERRTASLAEKVPIESIVLYRSLLGDGPARYDVVRSIGLSGDPGG